MPAHFMVAYSSSSIAMAIIAGHFVFSSAASSMSAFVPALAAQRRPLNLGQPTSMLPSHGRLPLELRRQRPNSQICSLHTTPTNTTLSSEGRKLETIFLKDPRDSSKWPDPVAVLLSHCVPVLLLGMSLYGQMQVCIMCNIVFLLWL